MDNAVKASTVTFDLMKTVVMVAAATLASGMSHAFTAIAVGRDPVADGLRTLEGVTKIMLDFLPKIIKNIVKALEGVNVDQIKATVQAVESVMNGVPAITLGPNAANHVTSRKLSEVNNLYFPTEQERMAWLKHLSYSQFTHREMIDGTAMEILCS